MRRLFSAALVLMIAPLVGCPASSSEPITRANEASSVQAKTPAPSAEATVMPATTTPSTTTLAPPKPVETAKPADPGKPVVTATPVESSPPVKTGGCASDADCGGGQVCDACATGKCCAQGCHTDAQCSGGQKCQKVQCIRAPCPGQCSAR